ncbi:MAG: hypothetical protein LBQ79_02740 [Deltaproteobacteria bacterium]|jgi:hypothetical protein|nr:hypothetical protein [Deltaproteobacteria bacterium]
MLTSCPFCGTGYGLDRRKLGETVGCARCGKPFTVAEDPPEPSRAPPEFRAAAEGPYVPEDSERGEQEKGSAEALARAVGAREERPHEGRSPESGAGAILGWDAEVPEIPISNGDVSGSETPENRDRDAVPAAEARGPGSLSPEAPDPGSPSPEAPDPGSPSPEARDKKPDAHEGDALSPEELEYLADHLWPPGEGEAGPDARGRGGGGGTSGALAMWAAAIAAALVTAGTAAMFFAVYGIGAGGEAKASAIGFLLVAFLMLIQIVCLGAAVRHLARIRDALSRISWW